MWKLVVSALGVALIAGVIGYVSVLESDAEAGSTELQSSTEVSQRFTDITWKKVMESVADYYTPPPPKEESKKGEEENKPAPKPTLISDARLMGVVEGDNPAALVALPKSNDVKRVTLGQSWLSPWQLASVHADSVIWKNTETNNEHIQYLFR